MGGLVPRSYLIVRLDCYDWPTRLVGDESQDESLFPVPVRQVDRTAVSTADRHVEFPFPCPAASDTIGGPSRCSLTDTLESDLFWLRSRRPLVVHLDGDESPRTRSGGGDLFVLVQRGRLRFDRLDLYLDGALASDRPDLIDGGGGHPQHCRCECNGENVSDHGVFPSADIARSGPLPVFVPVDGSVDLCPAPRRFKYRAGTTQPVPRAFRNDERGVEGMPIRLLVAVTVGIAAFGLLVPMADSVEQAEQTEVTIEPTPRQVTVEPGDAATVRLDTVTTEGEPVEGTSLVVSGRSLTVEDGPLRFDTGSKSSLTVEIGTSSDADVPVGFRPTQNRGTLSLRVVPPPNGEYEDELANPQLTVRFSES